MNSEQEQAASVDYAVKVDHLSRAFRGKQALQDVTLHIPVGSIFGLVGLNGAGKTTLIRHLIGSLEAKHGSVVVLGDNPVRNPEGVLKKIGYLTEEDTLPTWMSVGELVDFTRAIYPTWDDAYATELCEMFGLSRGTKLRSLSKGQRARAGLLVAIAHRPELLLLDEPSSGLDPIARSDILEAIVRTISEDGRTVLFSSHLLDEVDRVCDVVALMRDGQIIETLTVEQLETRYHEIICRPDTAWPAPPQYSGAFGWRRKGEEWSAVIDSKTSAADESVQREQFAMIERRDITLERWFAARVGHLGHTNASQPADSSSSEVANDA
ncbi:MAG: ABC transporter ATP-binding protein [Pirellulaceae bacterium]|nr:ABC transporter ATP-binding protein [Pirellulaceae bacterium]